MTNDPAMDLFAIFEQFETNARIQNFGVGVAVDGGKSRRLELFEGPMDWRSRRMRKKRAGSGFGVQLSAMAAGEEESSVRYKVVVALR